MRVTGAGSVKSHLTSTARRVADGTRGAMRRSAERIVEEAKLNTPVDTHDLEESIQVRKTYDQNNGRLQIEIVAGEGLEDYALAVHENYEGEIAPAGPGPGTLEKMAANPGRHIGSGFLRRAIEDEHERLLRAQVNAVTRAIRE